MVELSTVTFECHHHRKHVPPWLQVEALSSRPLEPLPDGDLGLLAFADPTPTSYPGFIVEDDFGRVHHRVACRCGIESDVLEVERRLAKVESLGCAIRM